jgi:Peptidase A4 family
VRTITMTVVILASFVAGDGAASAQSAVKSIRATVPPEQETLVAFQTFPNAVCNLTGPDTMGHATTHKLYADEAGVVRFHVTPSAEFNQNFKVTLPCADGKQSEWIPIALRSSSVPTRDMPAPSTEFADRALRELGTPRTPLIGDPTAIPQEELLSMGYPPRPDPIKAPDRYDEWLRLASMPVTLIRPKLAPQVRDERFGNIVNSRSWAGYSVGPRSCNKYVACPYFDVVYGKWNVPGVWTPSSGDTGITGVWVGLDGAGSNDVLQTGTASEAWSSWGWPFTNYWSWTEWYPGPQHVISTIPVNPGDQVYAEAWYPGSGANGYLYLHNITQNLGSTVLIQKMPPGVTYFSGDSAEWILERPTKDNWGHLYPLAPFHWAWMSPAWAYENYVTEYNVGSNDFQYNMSDWGNPLVYPVLTGSTSFYWVCTIPSWGGNKPC